MRDALKKRVETCEKVVFSAKNFCHDCSYACYRLCVDRVWVARLYLVKNGSHLIGESEYMLVILPERGGSSWVVTSDIPTLLLESVEDFFSEGLASNYYATNEIMNMGVRRSLAELYTVYGKERSYATIPASIFIRERRHANELPLTGDIVHKRGSVFDLSCGRVIDAWLCGWHINEGFCSYITGKNAFKNPQEVVSRVEKFVEERRIKKNYDMNCKS